ncbi:MAG: beta-ketoacyl synthase N-terminal-like domain-containing protein [Acidimicrobiales bacterium]
MNHFPPIAIVGRACVLPGVSSPEELWDAVVSGTDLVTAVPAERWGIDAGDVMCDGPESSVDRTWSDRGGYVRDFDAHFDPTGFALSAEEVRALDPVFQWTFHTAREALRDAGHADADPARFGAVFGNLSFPSAGMAAFTQATSIGALADYGPASIREAGIPNPDPRNRFNSGLPALLLERALGLGGGVFAIDAACASSLYAIKLACDQLHDGTTDLMLAGAVNCADDLCIHLGFAALQALSRTGRSRPFHAEADGLVPAEGCGFVALRRLDDAVRDGDTIHGIIRGVGLSNDGRGRGMLVPSSEGQTRAIAGAFETSGLDPTDISLLECHATGTQVGDATEIRSTAAVYGSVTDLPVGSLKSNTGHLITAAGVAGLIKVIEAMRHGTRPPSLHADVPLDDFADSPFRLLQEAEPWDVASDGVRRAGVSAFGFGGNNAHLLVEEPGSAEALLELSTKRSLPPEPIAIVGIGVKAASATGVEAFSDAIIGQTPCLDERGFGAMTDLSLRLAAQRFPPNDLRAALAQQLAVLEVADEALAACGPLDGTATGVYVGMGTDTEAARFGIRWRLAAMAQEWGQTEEWTAEARDASGPPLTAAGVLGTMPNIVANRLNSQYDFAGPSFAVSAEERSGIEALEVATRALRSHEIDAALVGAVDLCCAPVHIAAAESLVDQERQVPGDAAVMFVLKRMTDAEASGETIYAVLPGARLDDDGNRLADRPDLQIGLNPEPDGSSFTHLFGHSHAASGLLHVAGAAILLHHRLSSNGIPLIASNPGSGTGLPAGVGPRTAAVSVAAMDGIGPPLSVLLAQRSGKPVGTVLRSPLAAPQTTPNLRVFSGSDSHEVLANLEQRRESVDGAARLVIVAVSELQFEERAARAVLHISAGHPPGEGVHYCAKPIGGELAFVFTAAGAAYPGMGAQLLRSMPELIDPISSRFPLRDTAGWIQDPDVAPSPSDFLWGTSLLSQAHVELSRNVLQLRPSAAIGYSSGESNSLYAFGIWSDMDAMRQEIDASGMMERELGRDFEAIARAWGTSSASWAMWNVLAPIADVEAAIEGEDRVHLAIINTATDVVIGGDSTACARVVEVIGARRCRTVEYNLACHVPEVAAAFHQSWVDVHTRAVTPMAGMRHYSNGTNSAYEVSVEACAAAITHQAEHTIDFPATVEAAYADGVRVFVEHGPASACTNFVREIFGDRDVLAVHLDRRGKNIEQVYEVAAALVAAGVSVDHEALTARLALNVSATDAVASESRGGEARLSFPAHPAPLTLPRRLAGESAQIMVAAPELPPVGGVLVSVGVEQSAPIEVATMVQNQMAAVATMHQGFVSQQASIHSQYLAFRAEVAAAVPTVDHLEVASLPPFSQSPLVPLYLPPPSSDRPGPKWDKEQLRIHSSGTISELFGPMFVDQDSFEFQCRMPEPPLLLADRVTGLAAEPGRLGRGTIWTETDVEQGAWYLNDGHMPAGFMIESGQADLMLISYMGIDLLNQGERVYRLLGCTLTYHGDLPSPGETLEYEIRITGHARHGDVRLFFFEYDCIVNGQPRLTVRDAQAGFFNAQELDEALGVLWTPEDGAASLDPNARVDPPLVLTERSSFTAGEVTAFSEGRLFDCFGPGYEWGQTHTRSPSIQAGPQLFIDDISEFDATGGLWGRGFMRCETAIENDDWFFEGHFKNDPCMPGNFMVEACVQAMSFYLAALGHTTRRDGWRFQPLPEQPFELKCRGEINPGSERVAYELHVEEVWSGPHPTVICDVLGYVDGKAAFHAHRIGVELVPGWPLTSVPELYEGVIEPTAIATDRNGFKFDWQAMISCAWGRPSEAFGSMYELFDGVRQSPRLPGPPYHFISRVTEIVGELDVCQAGMEIVCEYDIPDDAWYFDQNGTETMPFAVLLEAALQPCGWVASAVGSVTDLDEDLMFRNLDGTGTLVDELTRTAGVLTTKVKITNVSRAGGMIIEGFDVECLLGDRLIYTMTTVFGFFPPEAFANQVGLAITDDHRAQLSAGEGQPIDLTTRPAAYFGDGARLAEPMLLMIDRVHHEPGAGVAGLGVMRGEKDVDVDEWFFKAHFFQDPVQPGSLGIEALIQLLQCFMLDQGMAEPGSHFEPLMLDAPLTWKYRGQVTPSNQLITSVMEIVEVGEDERGPYVIGAGSLWCDGIRIYEATNMGVRIVRPASVELSKPDVLAAMQTFWRPQHGVVDGWIGEELVLTFTDRYVDRIMVEGIDTLDRLRGQPAIFLGNHQVQIESLIATNMLPALTGLPMTTVANAKHEHRWIGELISTLEQYPGFSSFRQIAYFDQNKRESMFEILGEVAAEMARGELSFFVHAEGTRANSSRDLTTRCSSVFIDLAIQLGVPIVPVRFVGGLPIEPSAQKLEFPHGHSRQDYWIGTPIESAQLAALSLRDRIDRVVTSINNLGVHPSEEVPKPGDLDLTRRVAGWNKQTGSHEVFAAGWQLLVDRAATAEGVTAELSLLLDAAESGTYRSDGTPVGDWLANVAELVFGPRGPSIVIGGFDDARLTSFTVNGVTHPHLRDHAINRIPVVPVVYALEWFARAASAHDPDLRLIALSNVRVLKGLSIPGFADGEDLHITISSKTTQTSDGQIVLSLDLSEESSGRLHYRCTATLESAASQAASPNGAGEQGLGEQGLAGERLATADIYGDDVLFHGAAFQVLDELGEPTESGLVAIVSGARELLWPAETWVLDPAALDGGLQLALLWTKHLLGGPSLPTSIGEVEIFGPPSAGLYSVRLTNVPLSRRSSSRVTCDVEFFDANATLIAALRGVETHLLPPMSS